MEAIILAGGLGTRLNGVIDDIPKPMAPINSKPFLTYILDYLKKNGIKKVIMAVGYKWEVIKEYFGEEYNEMIIEYSIEAERLGTGGAIKQAMTMSKQENIFIVNGDTYFDVNLREMMSFHLEKNSNLTIAVKPMEKYVRYGNVISKDFQIIWFEEKKYNEKGDINGGIYIIKSKFIEKLELQTIFSFEKDIMEKYVSESKFYSYKSDTYFIDIGIPEDYFRAQKEL